MVALRSPNASGGSGPCSPQPLPAGWPFALPGPAQQLLVSFLPPVDRRRLRLASPAATALVDAHSTRLHLTSAQLEHSTLFLQQRFPGARRMCLVSDSNRGQIQPAASWPAITSLCLKSHSIEAASQLPASLPNIKHLKLLLDADDGTRPISVLCQLWPRLASLQVNCRLDSHFQAFAALPSLTVLQIVLASDPDASNWAALASMRQLRSLNLLRIADHMCPQQTQVPLVDLRGLTQLTHLHWTNLDGWQPGTPPKLLLQLPSSLVTLHSQHLPVTALPALPHLTSLVLPQQSADQQWLVAVAAKCSSLACLQLCTLDMTVVQFSAQLPLLTALTVADLHGCSAADAEADTEAEDATAGTAAAAAAAAAGPLAAAFPQLQVLTAGTHMKRCSDLSPASPALFQGLTALKQLDVCGKQQHGRMVLDAAGFRALAALPALRELRLGVHVEHVAGVQLLTQLRSIGWVWGGCWCQDKQQQSASAIQQAFVATTAPLQLRQASLTFLDSSKQGSGTGNNSSVNACIAWLATAPALAAVTLVGQGRCEALTSSALIALGALPAVKHISFAPVRARMPGIVLAPECQAVVQQLIGSGLEVSGLEF